MQWLSRIPEITRQIDQLYGKDEWSNGQRYWESPVQKFVLEKQKMI